MTETDRESKENSKRISRGPHCLVVKVAEEQQNFLAKKQLQGFSGHIWVFKRWHGVVKRIVLHYQACYITCSVLLNQQCIYNVSNVP